VSIGTVSGGDDCFVDVAAMGVLVIDSPHAQQILQTMAASYALSPFMENGTVLTVGLDGTPFADRPLCSVATLEEAIDRSLATEERPVVIVAAGAPVAAATLERCSRLGKVAGRGAVLRAPSAPSGYRLRFDGVRHVLDPLGWEVTPVGVSSSTLRAVESTIEKSDRAVERIADVVPIERPVRPLPFCEPEWSLLVRVLGQVEVVSADGVTVPFERSKALELVVWLVLHRERPTRSKARAALWDADVRDATFSNVVSEARRAMARVVPPPDDEEWIGRTLTEELPLHPLVLSDADLLAARVDAARGLPSREAIEVLRPGLDLVTGLPVESCAYLWPDAEGHTSALVLLATGAAIELASHYLALGDIDGVFWATGQGLKVLSGHEELIAMRMRAYAMRGDLAGVRHEWESYERSLAADSWATAEPAPKLVALHKELLATAWPVTTSAAGA
jgi:DNA-binding SARP family transcriptional activator